MLIRYGAATAIALIVSQSAWGDCRYNAPRDAQIDATGIRKIVIEAGPGDLTVHGSATTQVQAKGKACADSQQRLDAVRIDVRREGDTIRLATILSDDDSFLDHDSLDLSVELPSTLQARIEDSSGDLTVSGIAGARVDDSSGDQTIQDISGNVVVADSSGKIDIKNVRGNVEVTDSSGDVVIADINGNVLIPVDSSGELTLRGIQGDVHIETDSSGDIAIDDVNRNVVIDNDSSGDIKIANVGGNLTIDHDSSGDISQRNVLGQVSLPRGKRRD